MFFKLSLTSDVSILEVDECPKISFVLQVLSLLIKYMHKSKITQSHRFVYSVVQLHSSEVLKLHQISAKDLGKLPHCIRMGHGAPIAKS